MIWNQLVAKKSLETLKKEMEGENRLRRALGPIALTALGVGAIIGAGIFVETGETAANKAGPSVILSYVVAGLGCAFAAFCYAEFAAMAPVAGSAYTYAYATLGELLAWIIGWDLILEYAMSCGVVAADWTKYFNEFLETFFKWQVPAWLSNDWSSLPEFGLNLPAAIIMFLVTIVLVIGIRESATTNAILVITKVGVVVFVIAVGCWYINPANWTSIPVEQRKFTDLSDLYKRRPDLAKLVPEEKRKDIKSGQQLLESIPRLANHLTEEEKENVKSLGTEVDTWGMLAVFGAHRSLAPLDDRVRSPFIPYGLSGIMVAAAAVFFAYIGFDSISTHAEEAKQPQRDVPIGIIASLAICTVLYFVVSAVITGMEPYPKIDPHAAVASAFRRLSEKHESLILRLSAGLIATGALAGMTSVLLITLLSQARIFLAMARDGLLPGSVFGAVHQRFRTPHISTMVTGIILSVVAAFTPIKALLNMVNIGTLLAFIIVCAAVMILRIRRPEVPRPFRCPALYLIAPLGILVNLSMMLFLPLDTWFRLLGWLAIGLVIYVGYGYRHTTLGQDMWRHLVASGQAPTETDYYRSAVYRGRLRFSLIFCLVLCSLAVIQMGFVLYLLVTERLASVITFFDPPIAVAVCVGISVFMVFMVLVNLAELRRLRAARPH